jgi:hypothetical protein
MRAATSTSYLAIGKKIMAAGRDGILQDQGIVATAHSSSDVMMLGRGSSRLVW